jgi:hypothetical protein
MGGVGCVFLYVPVVPRLPSLAPRSRKASVILANAPRHFHLIWLELRKFHHHLMSHEHALMMPWTVIIVRDDWLVPN